MIDSLGQRRRRWHPNRAFGRLSIRTKLTIAFVALSGLPALIVGGYTTRAHLTMLREAVDTQQQERLDLAAREMGALFRSVGLDLAFLAHSGIVHRDGSRDGEPLDGTAAETLLVDIMARKPFYHRIRLMDDHGVERLHVRRDNGMASPQPTGSWRNTGRRFYQQLLSVTPNAEFSFAPVELVANDTAGNLVAALSFVRRVGIPAAGEHILVADVYASDLLAPLEVLARETAGRVLLLAPSGHALFDSESKRDWSTLLSAAATSTALPADDSTGATVPKALRGLPPRLLHTAALPGSAAPAGGEYRLVTALEQSAVYGPVLRVQWVVAALSALGLLIALVLAWVAADQFTSPIRDLSSHASQMARGDYAATLHVETNDEIEDLARGFAELGAALGAREKDLRRRGAQLRALLDTMDTGVAVVSEVGEVLLLNHFLRARFGPAQRRVAATFGLVNGNCPRCLGRGWQGNDRCSCAHEEALDGRLYAVTGRELESFEGRKAVLETYRDISDQRRLERQVDKHTQQLEDLVAKRTEELRRSQAKLVQQEKMAAVGQLAAGLAHELGTPLTTVLCHGEMARETLAAQDQPELRESLDAIVSETERTRTIVRSLLDLSRSSPGEREILDLRAIVSDTAALLAPQLRKRQIELTTELPESAASVHGQANELRQLIVNLVRNAADATPSGGSVLLRVSCDQDGGRSLHVIDTGAGIEPANLTRLFDPFFTTKPPGSGTGLGLWISYNIARDHDGELRVESSSPGCTSMLLHLPPPTRSENV